jgi:chaperonin GroEL
LLYVQTLSDQFKSSTSLTRAEESGAWAVFKSLSEPFKQMAINSGLEDGQVMAEVRNKQKENPNTGYDFSVRDESNVLNSIKDMIAAGIVDPVKVTRLALENAVSIASTLVITETIIVDKPEPKADSAPMGGGMPGMGGMGF